MTDPFATLWLLMEAIEPTVSGAVVRRWPKGVFAKLSELKAIVPAADAKRVNCPECHSHDEEVVILDGPNGDAEYFVPCPEVGRAAVPPGARRRWTVDLNAVAVLLAATLRVTGRTTKLVDDRLWRLGRMKLKGNLHDILFARGLSWDDAAIVVSAIGRSHNPILFVPDEKPGEEVWARRIPPVIVLSDVIELGNEGFDIDPLEIVADILTTETKSESGMNDEERLTQKIRRLLKVEGKLALSGEVFVRAYRQMGSSRKAAAFLTESTETVVTKDQVLRAVKDAGGPAAVLQNENSDSIQRPGVSHPRDSRGKKLIQAKPVQGK